MCTPWKQTLGRVSGLGHWDMIAQSLGCPIHKEVDTQSVTFFHEGLVMKIFSMAILPLQLMQEKVQLGNDQEMAQSERKSHYKNLGGKNLN